MRVNAIILSAAFLIVAAGAGNARNVPTPKEMVSIWRNWKNEFDSRGGVMRTASIERPEEKGFSRTDSTSLDLIKGDFRLCRGETKIQGQPKMTWCRLTNSKYGATVEQTSNGIWKLIEVAPVAEYSGTPQSSSGISWLSEKFLVEIEDGTNITTRTNDAQNPFVRIDAVPPFEYVEIEASRESGWLPVNFVFCLTNPGEDAVVVKTSYEYDCTGKSPMIKFWEIELEHPTSGEEFVERYEYSYQDTTEPPIEECYLSFYGLPEPKWAQTNNRWWYVVGTILFGMVAFVAWRKIQSK